MKLFSFNSIRTRIIFWFLLITLIPLSIVMLITYSQRINDIKIETFNKLIAIRDLKTQQIREYLKESFLDMKTLSNDFEIRNLENAFENKPKSTEDIEKLKIASELLIRYEENYNNFDEIFIVDTNSGLVEISTDSNSIGQNKFHDSYFLVPFETQEMYIKDIYYSKKTNKPEMTISYPIYCTIHEKHIIGILIARINLGESLYKLLLNRVGLGKTGETLIVNKDGVVLNELLWYENAPLNLQISAKPALNASQGKTGISITKDYRGEDILAAYTYIPETEWGFVCKQDLIELNAPIRKLTSSFILLFTVMSGFILFLAIYIGNSITKPIIKLNLTANKIKEGDFSIRNTIKSEDEIGSLALAFNNMTTKIESSLSIQKIVADISESMIVSLSLSEFSNSLLKYMMKLSEADISILYILDDLSSTYEQIVSFGIKEDLLKPFNAEDPDIEFEKSLTDMSISYIRDIPENTILKYKLITENAIPKEIITIPVIVEYTVVALISIVNINKFNSEFYNAVKQSRQSINTSYSNLLSNERTRILADNLTKINQQLEAKNDEIVDSQQALTIMLEDVNETSDKLQEVNIKLETANKELEAFSYSVSHDLRAPLRAIDGFTRILMEDYVIKLDTEGKRLGSVIQHNTKKMGQLIDDLLDFTRLVIASLNPTKIDMKNMDKIVEINSFFIFSIFR